MTSAMEEKQQTVEEFLAEDQVEYAKVPGFKAGSFMWIRSLTAGEVLEWQELKKQEKDTDRVSGLRLIIRSLCNAKEGPLVLNDSHLEQLKKKSHRVTEAIVREILKLNGMTLKQQLDGFKEEAKKG